MRLGRCSFSSRAYQQGDEQGITKLYSLVYGEDMTTEHWRWRYKQAARAHPSIGLVMYGNELVAHYAIRPVAMKIGDTTRTAALSLDTMVHPDHQREGLFVTLAGRVYDWARGRGVPIVYGFPNENSHHGIVARLGWVDLAKRAPLLVRPLQVRNVLAARLSTSPWATAGAWLSQQGFSLWDSINRFHLPANCSIQQITSFDQRFDALWEDVAPALNIAVVRDSEYLNWRYVEKPKDTYSIFAIQRTDAAWGYVVLKQIDRFGMRIGFLVDLLAAAEPPDLASSLIRHAVQHFKHSGADIVSCLMFEHSPYARALRSNGFVPLPIRFHPQEMYVGVRRNTDEYGAEFLTDPGNWYITWGDHDDI